jgi:hypothetical protein
VEQGLGLAYRIEFDTFGDLFRKIFRAKKEREKDKLSSN